MCLDIRWRILQSPESAGYTEMGSEGFHYTFLISIFLYHDRATFSTLPPTQYAWMISLWTIKNKKLQLTVIPVSTIFMSYCQTNRPLLQCPTGRVTSICRHTSKVIDITYLCSKMESHQLEKLNMYTGQAFHLKILVFRSDSNIGCLISKNQSLWTVSNFRFLICKMQLE